MMQGDSYGIQFEITDGNGSLITADKVADVEISIGTLRKTYASGTVAYDPSVAKWIFRLSQDETFKMLPARVKIQLRVKWANGEVEGCDLGYHNIRESISKEVL